MITDRGIFLGLMRGNSLHLCHELMSNRWVLIESNGRQPPDHVIADSVVSPKIAAWAIAQRLIIDIFAGRHGKYENHIYHLVETVPPETTAYIKQRFPETGR